ncbi:Probable transposase [Thorsellia anophelis DSM 18579]|uniref:Probable transposase n=1 Tax=Thorsellia anophelis DSM 18579 TaxID=1123402 RepID=A0A1I0BCV8_9GAMM|nr:Probable transposase [Thorsellia anophelis DSM 18579]
MISDCEPIECFWVRRFLSKTRKTLPFKVEMIHSKIYYLRRDSLHKATTTISKKHAMVNLEDL